MVERMVSGGDERAERPDVIGGRSMTPSADATCLFARSRYYLLPPTIVFRRSLPLSQCFKIETACLLPRTTAATSAYLLVEGLRSGREALIAGVTGGRRLLCPPRDFEDGEYCTSIYMCFDRLSLTNIQEVAWAYSRSRTDATP